MSLLRRDARMPWAQDALERLLRRDARMPWAQDALERPTYSADTRLCSTALDSRSNTPTEVAQSMHPSVMLCP